MSCSDGVCSIESICEIKASLLIRGDLAAYENECLLVLNSLLERKLAGFLRPSGTRQNQTVDDHNNFNVDELVHFHKVGFVPHGHLPTTILIVHLRHLVQRFDQVYILLEAPMQLLNSMDSVVLRSVYLISRIN